MLGTLLGQSSIVKETDKVLPWGSHSACERQRICQQVLPRK